MPDLEAIVCVYRDAGIECLEIRHIRIIRIHATVTSKSLNTKPVAHIVHQGESGVKEIIKPSGIWIFRVIGTVDGNTGHNGPLLLGSKHSKIGKG